MKAMAIDKRNFLNDDEDDNVVQFVPDPPPATKEPPPTKSDTNPPPHAVGPEKQILSLFLAWPETRQKLLDSNITPAHFHLPGHRGLWETMMDLHAEGREIDTSSLLQHLLDRDHLQRIGGPAAIADIQSYALSAASLDTHLELLTRKHAARLAMERARSILKDIEESPEEVAETIQRAAEQFQALADSATASTPLLARAYAVAYDPAARPPVDEVLMSIGEAPIIARGNLTVLQGKQKVGKSAVVASLMGAALRGRYSLKSDTLGIEWSSEHHTGSILHFDTEQSPADWWGLVTRAFVRSGTKNALDRLTSIPLVQFSRKERLAILVAAIRDQHAKRGAVDLVIIDGVADLCVSPNDEEESLNLVAQLMALCHKYNTSIVCILHENPTTDQGKTRGHLGSELGRKAFANLRIDKDNEGISTLYGTDMRKRDIPKGAGVAFAWNEEERMHTVIGSAREIEAERAAQAAETKRRKRESEDIEMLEDITQGDAIPYSDLLKAVSESTGISQDAVKKRIPKWIKAGILVKNQDGNYALK